LLQEVERLRVAFSGRSLTNMNSTHRVGRVDGGMNGIPGRGHMPARFQALLSHD
jgi:hypothetical protein